MYRIRKISTSTYNTNGTPHYDQSATVTTFRNLVDFAKLDTTYHHGVGSNVYRNGEYLCSLSSVSIADDFHKNIDGPRHRLTLAELREYAAEIA